MSVVASDFEQIFRERRHFFLRVLTRRLGDAHVAEEVLQEAFIQFAAVSKRESIDNPDGYLMRIAVNLSTDWLRREKSRRRREREWVSSSITVSATGETEAREALPDQALAAKEELARLHRHLETLSLPVRTAFILHKIEGRSHDETANKMGLSKSTVEKHIMKAMRYLIDAMAGGDALSGGDRG